MKILHILALVALSLVSSAALARPPMETNQLVDDTGTPIGTATNPLFTSGGSGGTVAQGAAATDTSGNRWPVLAYQGGSWSFGLSSAIPAGTNTIGNTVPAASAGNIGPTATFTVGGSSLLAKASPGNLYGFSVTAGGTAGYLAILNATAAPSAGAAITPLECIPVAINSYVARRADLPDRYGTGITAVFTSSCTTFTAVAPQVVSLYFQ